MNSGPRVKRRACHAARLSGAGTISILTNLMPRAVFDIAGHFAPEPDKNGKAFGRQRIQIRLSS